MSSASAVSVDLPFETTAPALARHILTEHAATLPVQLREDAELLVSEIVTNAVRYGEPSVTLRVRVDSALIAVEVADHGRELPILPDGRPDPTVPSGRGLLIVAAVAAEWGIVPHTGRRGKTVWFELRS